MFDFSLFRNSSKDHFPVYSHWLQSCQVLKLFDAYFGWDHPAAWTSLVMFQPWIYLLQQFVVLHGIHLTVSYCCRRHCTFRGEGPDSSSKCCLCEIQSLLASGYRCWQAWWFSSWQSHCVVAALHCTQDVNGEGPTCFYGTDTPFHQCFAFW